VRTVATNLIEGGALVIAVLLLMLGDLRGGLLVASIIPLALLGTFIVMEALGISGNLMSLGALDFGLIIDGAIVVVENITRRLALTGARGPAVEAEIRRATAEVFQPVLYGTAIIMIVYVPVLALQGVEGKMFRPMATVVLSALTVALLLALTWVPGVASRIFARGVAPGEPLVPRLAHRLYAPLLTRAMPRRALMLTLALTTIAGGGLLAARMGAEFVPRLDEGAIAMQAIRPPSVSLAESIAATTRIERTLRERFPAEIDTIVSRTGRAEIATDPMGVEISDIYLMLHPIDDWQRATHKTALVEAIEETLAAEIPGQNYVFSQPIELRTNELISGVRSDVAVAITGPDLTGLQTAGDQVMTVLRTIPGAADVTADPIAGLPVLRVIIDRPAAARHGVDAADVLDAIAAMAGRPVGVIFDGPARHPLQVRLAYAARSDRQAIERLLVASADGTRVPLQTVAAIVVDEGPAVVNRHDGQRRLVVQVNVRGRDLAGFVAEARQRVRADAGLAPGYIVDFGGQFENLRRASERLTLAVPAALAAILLLLYTAFGALRPALIIYLAIPMAAAGGVAALWLRDMPLSISAAIGFIALSGIAVLNGVVMVACIRDLQRDGLPLREAAEEGARLRLRAVLMTALTDGLGFLPMALSLGAGAEVQRPLATVVLGGLITSTVLTLFVLPTLYGWLGGSDGIADDPDAMAEGTPLTG
jgi:cobalt-zinc-cadmium resistance protein CzcA